jgi:hypothetical protein
MELSQRRRIFNDWLKWRAFMVADLIDPPVSKSTEEFTRAYNQAVNLAAMRMGLRRQAPSGWYVASLTQLDELNKRVRAVLEASA